MRVRWDEDNDGEFDNKPTACPAKYEFLEGGVYFLEYGVGGAKLNATLEVTAGSDREIMVDLPIADIKRIASGHPLLKVYVSTKKSSVEEMSTWDEVPNWNDLRGGLVREAERKGKVLAVMRIR